MRLEIIGALCWLAVLLGHVDGAITAQSDLTCWGNDRLRYDEPVVCFINFVTDPPHVNISTSDFAVEGFSPRYPPRPGGADPEQWFFLYTMPRDLSVLTHTIQLFSMPNHTLIDTEVLSFNDFPTPLSQLSCGTSPLLLRFSEVRMCVVTPVNAHAVATHTLAADFTLVSQRDASVSLPWTVDSGYHVQLNYTAPSAGLGPVAIQGRLSAALGGDWFGANLTVDVFDIPTALSAWSCAGSWLRYGKTTLCTLTPVNSNNQSSTAAAVDFVVSSERDSVASALATADFGQHYTLNYTAPTSGVGPVGVRARLSAQWAALALLPVFLDVYDTPTVLSQVSCERNAIHVGETLRCTLRPHNGVQFSTGAPFDFVLTPLAIGTVTPLVSVDFGQSYSFSVSAPAAFPGVGSGSAPVITLRALLSAALGSGALVEVNLPLFDIPTNASTVSCDQVELRYGASMNCLITSHNGTAFSSAASFDFDVAAVRDASHSAFVSVDGGRSYQFTYTAPSFGVGYVGVGVVLSAQWGGWALTHSPLFVLVYGTPTPTSVVNCVSSRLRYGQQIPCAIMPRTASVRADAQTANPIGTDFLPLQVPLDSVASPLRPASTDFGQSFAFNFTAPTFGVGPQMIQGALLEGARAIEPFVFYAYDLPSNGSVVTCAPLWVRFGGRASCVINVTNAQGQASTARLGDFEPLLLLGGAGGGDSRTSSIASADNDVGFLYAFNYTARTSFAVGAALVSARLSAGLGGAALAPFALGVYSTPTVQSTLSCASAGLSFRETTVCTVTVRDALGQPTTAAPGDLVVGNLDRDSHGDTAAITASADAGLTYTFLYTAPSFGMGFVHVRVNLSAALGSAELLSTFAIVIFDVPTNASWLFCDRSELKLSEQTHCTIVPVNAAGQNSSAPLTNFRVQLYAVLASRGNLPVLVGPPDEAQGRVSALTANADSTLISFVYTAPVAPGPSTHTKMRVFLTAALGGLPLLDEQDLTVLGTPARNSTLACMAVGSSAQQPPHVLFRNQPAVCFIHVQNDTAGVTSGTPLDFGSPRARVNGAPAQLLTEGSTSAFFTPSDDGTRMNFSYTAPADFPEVAGQEFFPIEITAFLHTAEPLANSFVFAFQPRACSLTLELPVGAEPASCAYVTHYDNCSVTCQSGYVLSGLARQCLDGSFLGTAQSCIGLPCAMPAAPKNGSAGNCTASATLPHLGICSFACSPGFTLTGPAENTCVAQRFPAGLQNCTGNPCAPLPLSSAPLNGSLGACGLPILHDTSCNVACDPGFHLAGGPAPVCVAGVLVTGAPQTCAGNPCDAVSTPPANGVLGSCALSTPHLATCAFGCEAGYTLVGSARQCVAGVLTGQPQTCAGNPCAAVTVPPANGGVGSCGVGGNGTFLAHLAACNVTCDAGYSLSGAERLCVAGVLTGQPQVCAGNPCAALTVVDRPANGSLAACAGHTLLGSSPVILHRQNCSIACDAGYGVNGANRSCVAGVLQGAAQTCLGLPCVPPVGEFHTLGSCPAMIPSDASCSLGCVPGFTLSGAGYSCLLGVLSGGPQVCTGNPCAPLPLASAPLHGTLGSCGPTAPTPHNTSCAFTCDAGYHLAPAPTRLCFGEAFQGPAQTCEPNPCLLALTPPSNGGLGTCGAASIASGTNCSFSCNPGFFVTGDARVCTTGSLGGVDQTCAACAVCTLNVTFETTACSSATNRVCAACRVCSGNTWHTRDCDLARDTECTPMWQLGGTISGLQGTGLLLSSDPQQSNVLLRQTLSPINNGSYVFPTRLLNGTRFNVSVLSQPSGARCVVVAAGFSAEGIGADVLNANVLCGPGAPCAPLALALAPAHGELGTCGPSAFTADRGSCAFSCSAGYTLNTSFAAVASPSHTPAPGQWALPLCDNGKWLHTDVLPNCVGNPCAAVSGPIAHGDVGSCGTTPQNGGVLPHLSQCSITCQSGFYVSYVNGSGSALVGGNLTCVAGSFAGTQTCVGLACAAPATPDPTTGTLGNCTGGVLHGAMCELACNADHHRAGDPYKCQLGVLSGSQTCSPNVCPPLDASWAPLNGNIGSCGGSGNGSALASGALCSYGCDSGYVVSGLPLQCVAGKIAGANQTCVGAPCDGDNDPPAHGSYGNCGPGPIAHGVTCNVGCDSGYHVEPSQGRACAFGVLNGANQTCVGNPCSALSMPPANGGLGSCGFLLRHGESCSYACNANFRAVGYPGNCSLGVLTLPTQVCVVFLPPTAPRTPIVAVAGDAQAVVSFVVPLDDGNSPILTYIGISSPGAITSSVLVVPPGNASLTSVVVAPLVNGQSYQFTVTAANAAGLSPPSPPSNSVTPLGVPGAPTITSVVPANRKATVSFTAPANTGGAPILLFTVTATPGGQVVSGTTSPLELTGLHNGVLYTVVVNATNVVGSGASSAPSLPFTPSNPCTPLSVAQAPLNGDVFSCGSAAWASAPGGVIPEGANCSVRCNAGYTLNETSARICIDGVLTGSSVCNGNPCPVITAQRSTSPVNGEFGSCAAAGGALHGATCQFTCDPNYYLTGPALNCTAGVWVGDQTCVAAGDAENPIVVIYVEGRRVTFNLTLALSSLGTDFLTFIPRLHVQAPFDSLAVTMDPDIFFEAFRHEGPRRGGTGVVRGSSSLPAGAYVTAEICGFQYNTHWNLYVRTSASTWQNVVSQCLNLSPGVPGERIDVSGCSSRTLPLCHFSPFVGGIPNGEALPSCPALTAAPLNGALDNCANPIQNGQTCSFTCNAGHTLVGAPRLCQQGFLSGQNQTCIPNNCTVLSSVAHGTAGSCAGVGSPASIPHQSSCSITCNVGYNVTNPARSCLAGSLLGPAQICLAPDGVPCDALTGPIPGGIPGTCGQAIAHGGRCDISCQAPLYVLSGESYTCNNGTLVGNASCIPLPCAPLQIAPLNGHTKNCDVSIPSGRSCNVTCDANYMVVGAPYVCPFGTGVLSGSQSCQPKSCVALADPGNGTAGDCGRTLAHGQSCNMSCNAGFKLVGAAVSCSFGVYSSAPQTCIPAWCAAPSVLPELADGLGTCAPPRLINDNEACSVVCTMGSTAEPSQQLCTNARLTGQTCVGNSCAALTEAVFGGRQGSCGQSTVHNATCAIECDAPLYVVSGSARKCSLGNWLGTPQRCVAAPCAPLNRIPNNGGLGECGQPVANGSSCAISCNNGYHMQGAPFVCINGNFLGDPTCRDNTCSTPAPPANGVAGSCNQAIPDQGSCAFECNQGFERRGDDRLSCNAGVLTGAQTCNSTGVAAGVSELSLYHWDREGKKLFVGLFVPLMLLLLLLLLYFCCWRNRRTVSVQPDAAKKTATFDKPAMFDVRVTNTGRVSDKYEVLVHSPRGWLVDHSVSTLSLTPKASHNVRVTVTPPDSTRPGDSDNNISFKVKSQEDDRVFVTVILMATYMDDSKQAQEGYEARKQGASQSYRGMDIQRGRVVEDDSLRSGAPSGSGQGRSQAQGGKRGRGGYGTLEDDNDLGGARDKNSLRDPVDRRPEARSPRSQNKTKQAFTFGAPEEDDNGWNERPQGRRLFEEGYPASTDYDEYATHDRPSRDGRDDHGNNDTGIMDDFPSRGPRRGERGSQDRDSRNSRDRDPRDRASRSGRPRSSSADYDDDVYAPNGGLVGSTNPDLGWARPLDDRRVRPSSNGHPMVSEMDTRPVAAPAPVAMRPVRHGSEGGEPTAEDDAVVNIYDAPPPTTGVRNWHVWYENGDKGQPR